MTISQVYFPSFLEGLEVVAASGNSHTGGYLQAADRDMAEAGHDAIEELPIALQLQGNMEVAIDIDGKQEATAPQNSGALLVGNGTRRRHETSSPSPTQQQQVSVGTNQGNNHIGVLIDTTVKVEAAAPPPMPLDGGSQGGDVELGPVNAPGEEPIADTESQGDDDEEEDEQASQPPKHAGGPGDAGGLPQQALVALIGNYKERLGQIIAFIGLGTITSSIGGYLTRGVPALFVYFLIDQEYYWNLTDDITIRDFLIQRHAMRLYYRCLPAFFGVGLLELCYGIWVSYDQSRRAGKRTMTVLIVSAFLLIVTVCFTGAGVNI